MSSNDQGLDRRGGTLHNAIGHVLIEARDVLPGTQLFLGFQIGSVFLSGFHWLPIASKYVHLTSLALVMLSTLLLLVPDAIRLAGLFGGATASFHRFAKRVVLAALVLLTLGITGDWFVAVRVVTGSSTAGLIASLVLLAGWSGVWLGCKLLARAAAAQRGYDQLHEQHGDGPVM